jgi:hypothetical protein
VSRKTLIVGAAGVLVGAGFGLIRFHPTDTTATASQSPLSAVKAVGAKRGVPRFIASKNGEPVLETNPTKPGYDPTRFRGILSVVDLYQREPRLEVWSKTIEEHLTQGLKTDFAKLLPAVTIDSVECRSTVCRLGWTGPKNEEDKLIRVIEVLYPPSSIGFGRRTLFVQFWYPEVQVGDARGFLNGISAARSKQLNSIRRLAKLAESYGKKMPDQRIPDEAWPDK